MIHIVTAENIHCYAAAMEQAYRLRHAKKLSLVGIADDQSRRYPDH
jgi:hypothetical protein